MGRSNRFQALINRLPIPVDDVIGMGMSHFITEQEPEEVKFVVLTKEGEVSGYAIEVKTDKKNVKEAKDFWTEEVEPNL